MQLVLKYRLQIVYDKAKGENEIQYCITVCSVKSHKERNKKNKRKYTKMLTRFVSDRIVDDFILLNIFLFLF